MTSKRERELKGKLDIITVENMGLHKQIYDANQILNELNLENFATGETRQDGTEYYNFNIDKWFVRLRESLSLDNISTKEGKQA